MSSWGVQAKRCPPPSTCTSYGSAAPFSGPQARKLSAARPRRLTWDLASAAVCLFLPSAVFTAVCALLTFSVHYHLPHLSRVLCAAILAAVLVLGYMACTSYTARVIATGESEAVRKAIRYIFLFATSLLGWVAGIAVGHLNFENNMSTYFDITNMNVYPAVDPSSAHGQELMDAGRIIFTAGSRLDLSKSMGFMDADMHCVAPVTIGGPGNVSSYDFWAVGLNCCSSRTADFRCGEYNNPHAAAGLRLVRSDHRAQFRLAVQQAEAAYKIRAQHPIFLRWLQDPVAKINSYHEEGYRCFLLGMFGFFIFQMFAVAVALVFLSKMES
eukprot:CAMPEP_0204605062 /NCGR_PEP_ID=MMETSP0661-20131031/58263_1 /ASSEMBLY_ACC=CAM_ASM_000606 /TAXON_ID=109239 /ORGANISM="Alexandrium margalefi, Strain AMGDE01CS-322" /LENGTH=326 /DNA_ID=CAMNT_0051616277 /DNA_START=97 /DNA_END=1077 /DNA_ORIENTATION=+